MKTRLLVVDDDAEARGLLDYVLCGAGYDVTLATTGIEAVEKARQLQPDLVLLDIMLPDMDGFSVAELLRHRAATSRAVIIMLSAYGGMSVHARGLECGVHSCLLKTAGVESILASVQAALSPQR